MHSSAAERKRSAVRVWRLRRSRPLCPRRGEVLKMSPRNSAVCRSRGPPARRRSAAGFRSVQILQPVSRFQSIQSPSRRSAGRRGGKDTRRCGRAAPRAGAQSCTGRSPFTFITGKEPQRIRYRHAHCARAERDTLTGSSVKARALRGRASAGAFQNKSCWL